MAKHEDETAERRAGGKPHQRVEPERRQAGKHARVGGKAVRPRVAAESVRVRRDGREHAAQDTQGGAVARGRAENAGGVETAYARLREDTSDVNHRLYITTNKNHHHIQSQCFM